MIALCDGGELSLEEEFPHAVFVVLDLPVAYTLPDGLSADGQTVVEIIPHFYWRPVIICLSVLNIIR